MPVCRRIFGTAASRFTACLLLPLYLTVGLLGSGGWFCADGTHCRPAAAATCCCDDRAAAPVDDCCPSPARSHSIGTAGATCGCYYQDQSRDSLVKLALLLDSPSELPTGTGIEVAPPPSARARYYPPAATPSPPRYLLSPRNGRAPPHA